MEPKYEVVESFAYRHKVTGQKAGFYGAFPGAESDRHNWEVISQGWTLRNRREGTIGIGRMPFKTKAEAETHCEKLNRQAEEYRLAWEKSFPKKGK